MLWLRCSDEVGTSLVCVTCQPAAATPMRVGEVVRLVLIFFERTLSIMTLKTISQ